MQANDFLFFLPLVLAALVIWGYLRRNIRKQESLNEIWRVFARLKGLQEQSTDNADETIQKRLNYEVYDPILSFQGKNQNLPFFLECLATEGTPMQIGKLKMRRGDKIRIFTRIKIGLTNLPKGLRVYRVTAWSKLGKAAGMQDISTGDARFDKMFMVKGCDPKDVLDFLTPSRRVALLTNADKLQSLELEEEGLILMQPGQIDSMEKLEEYFAELGSLASALKEERYVKG